MGDRKRRDAQILHRVDDQIVDDVGHDRIKARGRLVEEDDVGIGGDGARQPHALLHAAGQFGRRQHGDICIEADLGELLDGDVARLAARHAAALDQAEGDILPHRQAVEERGRLEQHAEFPQHRVARAAANARHILAIDEDLALVGPEDAEHAFDHHRFAGARAADHHQRFPGIQGQVDAVEHDLAAEALLDAPEFDLRGALKLCHVHHRAKMTEVSR